MKTWLLIGLLGMSWPAHASDIPGSSDLSEVSRPLGSDIVRYADEMRAAIRFPLERVERVNNRLVIDKELDVEGRVIDITYRLDPSQVYGAYMEELEAALKSSGADVLFSCKGRGCGSSGLWANSLFKGRELYGPSNKQEYLAAKLPGTNARYFSAYGIERGNRRQYVHLRLVESGVTDPDFKVVPVLVSTGRVELPVIFSGNRVSPESRAGITKIALGLKKIDPSELAIVAFRSVTPGGTLNDAIDQSKARAEHVQVLLRDAGFEVPHAYGLGPLVSPGALSPDRVEIVKFK